MNHSRQNFGPWASNLNTPSRMFLSSFWRRRMETLQHLKHTPIRFTPRVLLAGGLLMLAVISVPLMQFAPADPDPQAILNEARADVRNKRYASALAKHVWFHEHALEYRPAMSGVRLSFALSDWRRLGEVYPPAHARLKATRDQAAKNVLEGIDVYDSFSELAAVNKKLGLEHHTKELFLKLDAEEPESAKKVFRSAQSTLIKTKEYALCAKYIRPQEDFRAMKMSFEISRENAQRRADDPRFGNMEMEFTNKSFTNKVGTLVAILAVNDRQQEAEEIAKAAKAEWDDTDFHKAIDSALEGNVPDPWP